MAMGLADTFLVHRRSCFAILFRGKLRTGVCPVLFGQRRQPPPSGADSSVIAFLDSYEVRFKVRRRTRGADGRRHLRRNKRK